MGTGQYKWMMQPLFFEPENPLMVFKMDGDGDLEPTISYMYPGIPTTIKTMGVNITTIVYLRVPIIQIGSTIILMVVGSPGCKDLESIDSQPFPICLALGFQVQRIRPLLGCLAPHDSPIWRLEPCGEIFHPKKGTSKTSWWLNLGMGFRPSILRFFGMGLDS